MHPLIQMAASGQHLKHPCRKPGLCGNLCLLSTNEGFWTFFVLVCEIWIANEFSSWNLITPSCICGSAANIVLERILSDGYTCSCAQGFRSEGKKCKADCKPYVSSYSRMFGYRNHLNFPLNMLRIWVFQRQFFNSCVRLIFISQSFDRSALLRLSFFW